MRWVAMTPAHALQLDAAPEASDFFFGSVLGQGSYAKVSTLRTVTSTYKGSDTDWMMVYGGLPCSIEEEPAGFCREGDGPELYPERKQDGVCSDGTEGHVTARASAYCQVLLQLSCTPLISGRFRAQGRDGSWDAWIELMADVVSLSLFCKQDQHSLYLVLELCRGGDLFGLIRCVCVCVAVCGFWDKWGSVFSCADCAILLYNNAQQRVSKEPGGRHDGSCMFVSIDAILYGRAGESLGIYALPGNYFCGEITCCPTILVRFMTL